MAIMEKNNIEKMAMIFRMLSNPNRLQVLCLCLEKAISVGDLVDNLELSQSLVSHHLKQLRDMNLIQATRQGKNVFYQVQDERVQCILKDMLSHIGMGLKKEREKR